MPVGLAIIEIAKQNGSWSLLDEVEDLRLPADLEPAFAQWPAAHAHFLSLSRTAKRNLLLRLVLVKQPATRLRHITAILELGG
jgi:uncharacterized protein YdeI (YjbR/CyaY-like superfamily)